MLSSWQIRPSPSFLRDAQTWTHTWPAPRTFILNVGRFPAGTLSPAWGATGVMPPRAEAAAVETVSQSAAATAGTRSRRTIGSPYTVRGADARRRRGHRNELDAAPDRGRRRPRDGAPPGVDRHAPRRGRRRHGPPRRGAAGARAGR